MPSIGHSQMWHTQLIYKNQTFDGNISKTKISHQQIQIKSPNPKINQTLSKQMNKRHPFPLFFLLPLFLLCFFNKINGESLINSTCRTFAKDDPNINYTFCYTSLQAAPASRCATLHGLGTISIRNLRYNVTDTRCEIKQLLKNPKLDHYVRQSLDVCFELYNDALDSVKQGMRYRTARTERFHLI